MPKNYNPMQHFKKWFFEADKLYNEREVNAMLLTTIGTDNFPKSRMVLLKKYTWEGFVFFTNYESEKAISIASNSKVSLQFNWVNSNRIVVVSGIATKISETMASNYFDLRPRGSKLGAWASSQSKKVNSRIDLEQSFLEYENKFKRKEIPKPPFWGGYLMRPKKIDFIQKKDCSNLIETFSLELNYTWSKKEKLQTNY